MNRVMPDVNFYLEVGSSANNLCICLLSLDFLLLQLKVMLYFFGKLNNLFTLILLNYWKLFLRYNM